MQPTLAETADGIVAPLVDAREFSGAIVLMRRGTVVHARGFGMANHEAGIEFTPETLSDGGSLAKTFTAAAVQWLAHEGQLELDAPVTRYLPSYPHAQTTLRHLISHSNGLPPYYEFFDPHFAADQVRTTPAMLEVIAREVPAPSFPPGSRFEYSNFAFDLAAMVIERVTGQTFEAFLRDRFFDPLSMHSSIGRPGRLADWQGVRTLGYRWNGNAWEVVDVFDMEAFLGASNLYFSTADLARWANANAAGTALPAAVFAAGQQRTMIGGHPSGITGLSWYCDDSGVRCYYTGDINAFHGFVYWDRSRGEAAAFTSNSSLPPWSLITLQRALVDALAGRPVGDASRPEFVRIEPDSQRLFVGTYAAQDIGKVQVTQRDQGMRVRIGNGLQFDAFQLGDEILYVPGLDIWIGFSAGLPPARMHLRSMFIDAVAHRVDAAPGPGSHE